ncbi:MAG: nucleoside triphosphate pyrophosphohydrolase [Candidatus Paceibacterota bacterium]|jgi:predicted house-cleaning noncanonical NTP pyrophosphatase (MazG superfamily)
MKYEKLVRDKVPEHIRSKGENPITHIAESMEYWQKLKDKLLEEAKEFNADESSEEFADLLEVIDAIAKYKGFKMDEIERIKEEKARNKGRFNDRIILDETKE